MKKNFKHPFRTILLFVTLLWTAGFAMAQPASMPMTAGSPAAGITYCLPKTAFQIHLLIEKTTYQPGPFAHYAYRYLNMDDVAMDEDVEHQVVKFDITSIGVRDTAKCYNLLLKGGKAELAEVSLSDDGVLLAINDQPLIQKSHKAFRPTPQPRPLNPQKFLSADVQMAGSVAKKAQIVARQIAELQERRQLLIMGEADEEPKDNQQLQTILNEIDRSQQALMTLFVGTITRDTTEHTLTVCPMKEVKGEIVFRLSRQMGLVDNDDLSGVPYMLTVEDLYKTDTVKYLVAENKHKDGLYVNVPGRVRLTFSRENTPLATFEQPAAQFGFVELRDMPTMKRYVTHIQLHPATGAIVKTVADVEKK